MAWLYTYGFGSLVLATIFGLVAFALSAESKAPENNLVKSTTLVVYSSMGIATGVFTLLTVPIMLLRSNASGGLFSSTVLFELLWTSIFWVLWTITAIIAFGLSIHTNIAGNGLDSALTGSFNVIFQGSLTFARLGIAAGIITLIFIPILLLSDHPKVSPVRPLILLEVPVVSLLWILWISAGVSTASFASANQDFHIHGAWTCDDFQAFGSDAKTICNDSKPTIIFDIATGAILLLYTAALVIVASTKAYGGHSIWSMTVKESEV